MGFFGESERLDTPPLPSLVPCIRHWFLISQRLNINLCCSMFPSLLWRILITSSIANYANCVTAGRKCCLTTDSKVSPVSVPWIYMPRLCPVSIASRGVTNLWPCTITLVLTCTAATQEWRTLRKLLGKSFFYCLVVEIELDLLSALSERYAVYLLQTIQALWLLLLCSACSGASVCCHHKKQSISRKKNFPRPWSLSWSALYFPPTSTMS